MNGQRLTASGIVSHVDQIIAQRIRKRFRNKFGVAGPRKIQNHDILFLSLLVLLH
jgi:hypothetical protein